MPAPQPAVPLAAPAGRDVIRPVALPWRGAVSALLRHRRWLIVAAHIPLLALGYALAFALRFDFALPADEVRRLWLTLPLLLAVRLGAFAWYGLFQGMWRHAGLPDLIRIAKAVTVSSAIVGAVLVAIGQIPGLPRSVLIIDWLLAIFAAGGVRFAARYVREGQVTWSAARGRRTLLVGAGSGAERLLRLLQHERRGEINVVGLVDDDPAKRGLLLHGVPVLGGVADLAALVASRRVELVVIAIPSATGEQMRRIFERCAATKVQFRVLPSLRELLTGERHAGELRKVELEDLLGRSPVQLDMTMVERDLADQVVLVTGGAGSIGSELVRQIARFRPRRLVILDQAESPLYFVHLELRKLYPDLDVVPVIGSVTDEARLDGVFAAHRPAFVFHAAAYKHVPMMESNILEAVRNNVFGTLRVTEAAAHYGARRVVLISTDKAVKPSSVMGATKRVAERIARELTCLTRSTTDFRAVRFGNVLGSDGSVVPLFERQLRAGGPLTVTHPHADRYFMTIPEAVQLVLQAASLPEAAGCVSMLEMGEPVRVLDLAENVIRLSGREPYREVPIVFTGLRPGEKLHEELSTTAENSVPSSQPKIRIVQLPATDGAAVERGLSRLAAALLLASQAEVVAEICALVPECVSPLRELGARATMLREAPLATLAVTDDGPVAPSRRTPAWSPMLGVPGYSSSHAPATPLGSSHSRSASL